MRLWMVQQFVKGIWNERDQKWDESLFEFTGIFDSRDKAINACRDHNYIVTPVTLNEQLPHERIDMPGAFYPISKGGDD